MILSSVLFAGVAVSCGSDEATPNTDAASTAESDNTSTEDTATEDTAAADTASADTAAGVPTDGAVNGDISMTFTVSNSQRNPSLNGVSATVTGYCSIRAEYDIFQLEGGTMSAPDAADRPDYVAFIAGVPVDGAVSGLLTVVEQGLESSSLTAQGTFDGTTLSITDADTSEPLFELVLSAPCTES